MNEPSLDLSERDSEADVTNVVNEAADDRLLTTRMPPITPPPMRPPSVPPGGQGANSFAPASGTYRGDTLIPSGYPSGTPSQQPRSSWWRALLTATVPPAAPVAPAVPDERVLRRRIGATCAGMAIGFVILALALGLRGVEPAFSPAVAAALVIARAMISLGFLAFGYALLRMAERFFASRPEAPPSSHNLH